MRSVVAITAHEISKRAPIRVVAGDQVEVGERDTDWPEFVFVTAEHGAGWVPARHLSTDSGHATVIEPYETTELPVQPGQVVQVLEEDLESGWVWCRDDSRREGWVPMRAVRHVN
jgi:hypothetical protein